MTKKGEKTMTTEPNDFKFPEGFENLNPKDVWISWDADTTVQGIVLHSEPRKKADEDGKFRNIITLRVTSLPVPLVGQRGGKLEGDKVDVDIQVGDEIRFDEKARLESLSDLASDTHYHEVYIHCGGKVRLDNGKSMWLFKIGAKKLGPRPAADRKQNQPNIK
jgi:hypothetical protein